MLHQAQADLDRTVIRAPMSGIIIDRSIAAGQTVAASFQAPTLFTIGDLHSVNVEIAVDEADVGELRLGQHVTFSVDAYPDKTFTARIVQIRKSPHVQETVVTYTVVAAAKNDDFLLFPGMTAKAEIVVGDVPDALQVPSAALRYEPKNRKQPAGSHVWVFYGTGIRPVTVSNEGKSESWLKARRWLLGIETRRATL
jgi:HlyD family secretion protein